VNCLAVRDRLLERVLGGLSVRETSAVDRHLAWCAACRKEVGELETAAGTLAFALAPVPVPAELEDRVVDVVSSLMRHRSSAPRRGRMAVAATVAAMLALGGLGWGAVMAGRATRVEEQAAADAQAAGRALADFGALIEGTEFSDATPRLADLVPIEGSGRGAALAVSSETADDLAVVLVSGLDPAGAPYTVELLGHEGDRLRVGRIRTLGPDGGGEVQRVFSGDELVVYERVVVLDRAGELTLQGGLMPVQVSPSAGA
jgi:hypothetical protein